MFHDYYNLSVHLTAFQVFSSSYVGDGLADIFGRKYGSLKLPWSHEKSWAGSITFIIGAYASCLTIGWIYIHQGFWGNLAFATYATQLVPLVLWCAFVESITTAEVDNLTVFIGGACLSRMLWQK